MAHAGTRLNCYPDGQTREDPKELYKGFIGNVAAFKQQDGASLLTSLPPRAADLAERIAIAFVGNSGELHKCHVEALQCSVDDVRSAYNLLRRVNATYADVEWDEVAADALSREGGALGLPETLQGCVGVPLDRTPDEAKVTLEGPADAVVEPLVGQPGEDDDTAERGDTVVGCAEEDIADDTSQHALRTKQLLLQQLDRDIENQQHEAEMRKSVPTSEATEARNESKERGRELQKEIKNLDVKCKAVRDQLAKVSQSLDPKVPPPNGLAVGKRWLTVPEADVVVVPTFGEAFNSFDPALWSSMDPKCFPFGDGVFGIDRDAKFTFREWVTYL